MKSIVFYENEECIWKHMYLSYKDTKQAIEDGVESISTLQMCFLSTNLFDLGYRVWIKPESSNMYEIYIEYELKSGRVIREGINLFKLWECREFD